MFQHHKREKIICAAASANTSPIARTIRKHQQCHALYVVMAAGCQQQLTPHILQHKQIDDNTQHTSSKSSRCEKGNPLLQFGWFHLLAFVIVFLLLLFIAVTELNFVCAILANEIIRHSSLSATIWGRKSFTIICSPFFSFYLFLFFFSANPLLSFNLLFCWCMKCCLYLTELSWNGSCWKQFKVEFSEVEWMGMFLSGCLSELHLLEPDKMRFRAKRHFTQQSKQNIERECGIENDRFHRLQHGTSLAKKWKDAHSIA